MKIGYFWNCFQKFQKLLILVENRPEFMEMCQKSQTLPLIFIIFDICLVLVVLISVFVKLSIIKSTDHFRLLKVRQCQKTWKVKRTKISGKRIPLLQTSPPILRRYSLPLCIRVRFSTSSIDDDVHALAFCDRIEVAFFWALISRITFFANLPLISFDNTRSFDTFTLDSSLKTHYDHCQWQFVTWVIWRPNITININCENLTFFSHGFLLANQSKLGR